PIARTVGSSSTSARSGGRCDIVVSSIRVRLVERSTQRRKRAADVGLHGADGQLRLDGNLLVREAAKERERHELAPDRRELLEGAMDGGALLDERQQILGVRGRGVTVRAGGLERG